MDLVTQPPINSSFNPNFFGTQMIGTEIPSYQPRPTMVDNVGKESKIPKPVKEIIKGGAKAMLDIACNMDIDIKKVQYPVYFEKRNICVHCAAEGSLVFVDVFGRETNREINAFEHIKCKCCGRTYSIDWKRDPGSSKMYPVPVDHSVGQQFSNFMNMREIKNKGTNDYY